MRAVFIFLFASFSLHLWAQGVRISETPGNPHASAVLELDSDEGGFLPVRMTQTERDGIASPAQGLQVFNTTSNCLEFFVGSTWQKIACACTGAPAAPAGNDPITGSGQVYWSWQPVAGATGYRYNTVNNYGTATNNGLQTIWNQYFLQGNTTYTLYVWAYNECGNSAPLVMTATTLSWSCGSVLPVQHVAGAVAPVSKAVNYGTIQSSLSGSAKCWITQNLGADRQANAATDNSEAAAGWYWQFNRAQGYRHDGVTRTPATAWITTINESSNWTGANDPCTLLLGTGWRIPTGTEWSNATSGWTFTTAYSSVLRLHLAGLLSSGTGALGGRGDTGAYWSATQSSSTQAGGPYFTNLGLFNQGPNNKPNGFSLRCLRD